MKQLFFFLLAMMMVLTACARPTAETTPATAPEVTAELETPEPEAPTGEEVATEETEKAGAEPAAEEKQEAPEQPKEKAQIAQEYATPNIVVVSEKTVLGSAADIEKKEEKTSWFSDVICGKLFPDGQSFITFTIENKGKKEYHLDRITVEELTEKDGLSVRLNGGRVVTDAKKQCGTELLKPTQKATCTVKEKLRKGKTYWEKELFNKLEAGSVGIYTELKFTCEGMAE